jgi:hypothetical protein
MSADDPKDPTVKELLDGGQLADAIDVATQRELERWFGLPSFDQLADQPPAEPDAIDPEMAAVIERRDRALAAVDPELLAWIRRRTEDEPETLIRFSAELDVRVDPDVALLDLAMIERAYQLAEPREVEIAEELRDDMRECAPQALLRDLHRPELEFEKTFEIVDAAAEQRFDIVAEVKDAMAARWQLPELGKSPFVEGRELLAELRADRQRSWAEHLPSLPNRRVQE